MKKIKQVVLVLVALCGIATLPLLAPVTVAAQASDQAACEGLGGTPTADGGCTIQDEPDIETTIARIIQIMSAIAGIASVIMIIVAGFRFVTANGDANTVAAARRTMAYALIGVVIVAISQTIVWFVLRSATGD